MTMDAIVKILEGYKGVKVDSVVVCGLTETMVVIRARINDKQMPLAATKILNKYPNVSIVHFTGGWIEYVYTRRTLSYLGYNVEKGA